MKNLLILTIIVGIAQTAAASLTLCINPENLDNTNNTTQQAEEINISLELNSNLEYDKATGPGGIFVQSTENPAITSAQGPRDDIKLHHNDKITVDILLLDSDYGPKDFLAINLTPAQTSIALLDPDGLLRSVTDNLEN